MHPESVKNRKQMCDNRLKKKRIVHQGIRSKDGYLKSHWLYHENTLSNTVGGGVHLKRRL